MNESSKSELPIEEATSLPRPLGDGLCFAQGRHSERVQAERRRGPLLSIQLRAKGHSFTEENAKQLEAVGCQQLLRDCVHLCLMLLSARLSVLRMVKITFLSDSPSSESESFVHQGVLFSM